MVFWVWIFDSPVFLQRRFGYLSHRSIETPRNSVHWYVFPDIVTELTYFVRSQITGRTSNARNRDFVERISDDLRKVLNPRQFWEISVHTLGTMLGYGRA